VNGADTRACQHGNGKFQNHRQVNSNPVTLLNARSFERIGKYAYFLKKFTVSDADLRFLRVVGFPDQGNLVFTCREIAFKNILRDIQLAIDEPVDFWFGEIPIQDFVPLLMPLESISNLRPVSLRICDTFMILLKIINKTSDFFHHNAYDLDL
jgi:hypothetical protein